MPKTVEAFRELKYRGVKYWDYFIKTVQIDGIVFDVTANVRKKQNDAYVYAIQMNENKKMKSAPPRSQVNNTGFNRVPTDFKVEWAEKSATISTNVIKAQTDQDVNIQHSESEGSVTDRQLLREEFE